MPSITKTGGTWNPNEWPLYFAATSLKLPRESTDAVRHMLIAVNEIESEGEYELVEHFVTTRPVFVDSGVYNLTMTHALKHKMSMDQALGLDPDKLDGFEELFDRYVRIMKRLGNRMWGYIEIDAGGKANKIKTRTRLEKLGLRPIPVYHPLNDGWDYFDYLAQRYDRICMGNVVVADAETRKRLIATAWDRRRKYPDLWIHALGLTASELVTAFPIDSCDSSTWVSPVRWAQHRAYSANSTFGSLDLKFVYEYDHQGERGFRKAVRMCSYDVFFRDRQARVIAADQKKALGADLRMPIGKKGKRK